jgi:flagellin
MTPFRKPAPDQAPTDAKAACLYPNGARANVYAADRGFDAAVMCDAHGNVAEFASANLMFANDGVVVTPAANFTFLANSTGSLTVTLPIIDLRLVAGAGTAVAAPAADIYLGTTDVLDTAVNAATVRDRIAASLEFVNSELARLGASAKRIENHEIFVGKLQDSIKGGIGNLVDADLAVESARLQAAQVKQQLGTQALSIANQAPQSILSLFRQ